MPAELTDITLMRRALRLAQRAYGETSPNPLVGAILTRDGQIIGEGWHHRAGQPHAEIEALRDAQRRGFDPAGATLHVTLEPCSTHGRTPPCTEAIIAARIKHVVIAALDPNPVHAGRGVDLLQTAGITVSKGLMGDESTRMNESFNHWIVHRTPWVVVKAAMSLDGKIATVSGESKWITGDKSRAYGMKLRQGADAILVGVNTVTADDPSLTVRTKAASKTIRRIILDPTGRIPLASKVLCDSLAEQTIVVVTTRAPEERLDAIVKRASVLVAPEREKKINLPWLLQRLGGQNVTNLLVEGGGETNASFLESRLAHRVAFFYAPIVIGGRNAPKGVAGEGVSRLEDKISLSDVVWRKLGPDLLLTARVA